MSHSDALSEIVALHRFFEAWLRGDETVDFSRVETSLAEDFTFLPPNGGVVNRTELLEGLRQSHGERQVRIRIENPVIRWAAGPAVLATYEEWHDHAEYTTARRSSALLTTDDGAPGGYVWRLVHETWMQPPPGTEA